jgi:hypothetical protein
MSPRDQGNLKRVKIHVSNQDYLPILCMVFEEYLYKLANRSGGEQDRHRHINLGESLPIPGRIRLALLGSKYFTNLMIFYAAERRRHEATDSRF